MVKYDYRCSVVKHNGTHAIAVERVLPNDKFPQRLEISFQRTIRVPDNGTVNKLPPGLGSFTLHKIQDYAHRLPDEVVKKGGVFLPMHQKEAMWIHFKADAPFLVKIYVGGVNAISGEHAREEEDAQPRRAALRQDGHSIQDYVVLPDQPWLDGVAVKPGLVRQFVAMPMGQGYSVEAQLTGEDTVGGLQLEITPAKVEAKQLHVEYPPCTPSTTFFIHVETLTGKTTQIFCIADDTIGSIKRAVQDEQGIPTDMQRFLFAGKELEDHRTLADYNIKSGSKVFVVLRLRGGGDPIQNPHSLELAIAPGGLIKQNIREDKHDPSKWLKDMVFSIPVQILNSAHFRRVTGKNPPRCPIDARTYARAGLPFFDLFEKEDSTVAGADAFAPLKSVHEIQKARGELQEAGEDPLVRPRIVKLFSLGRQVLSGGDVIATADPDGLLDPDGPRRAFRTLADLERDVRRLNV